MKHEIIHLKEKYPFLGENGCDPTVEMYLPYNMTEMHRQDKKRPCMIVCPGGGRKNNFSITRNSRSTKNRWRSSIYRCRTCIRPSICKKIRCRYR